MAMKKKKGPPPAYVEATKDQRFAGTFEVLVPAPNRVRPQRVPMQFTSAAAAETWLYSPEGEAAIAEILREAAK
ncbi:MAG: hypothetical protein ACKVS5_16065 [Parvularculaceae bacterium]